MFVVYDRMFRNSRTLSFLAKNLFFLENVNVETDTFKKHLDDWLRTIPDTPKIDSYGASVPAASNSIVDQCMTKW